MSAVGVGIIGFGRIGNEHAVWIERASGVALSAVADATPARQALARARDVRVYEQVDHLLNDNSVDAVLVATPTAMHFEHVRSALSAGKHVMVEKPIALDLAQARQLVVLAESQKRVLTVFHNRRWDIDFLTVCDAIRSGVFGTIINIESRLGQFASCVGPAAKEYRPNWRNERAFGGGGLYDWGSHFVDQIWRAMLPSKPMQVYAQLRSNVWSSDCDDFARVLIDFDNGVAGLVEINTTTSQPLPRWQIDGTLGSASAPHSEAFDTRMWANLEFRSSDSAASTRTLPLAHTGFTEPQIWERFALAIRGHDAPAVPVRSVLPTMALLDAARESSSTGRAVEVEVGLFDHLD